MAVKKKMNVDFDHREICEGILNRIALESKYGEIIKKHKAQQSQSHQAYLILIFEDDPRNWSARLSLAESLSLFLNNRYIELVGVEGTIKGYIDTSQMSTMRVQDIKENVALYVLKELMINAGEYCHGTSKKPYYASFWLCGVEDPHSYYPSLRYWRSQDMENFTKLQPQRAEKMLQNLIDTMDKCTLQEAALICCGNLADFVCQEMEKQGIDYVRIRPNSSEPSDFVKYERRMRGESSPLENLLSSQEDYTDTEVFRGIRGLAGLLYFLYFKPFSLSFWLSGTILRPHDNPFKGTKHSLYSQQVGWLIGIVPLLATGLLGGGVRWSSRQAI